MESDGGERRTGYAAIMTVYLAWGLLPAYWKLLGGVPPLAVLAHRAFWAFLIMAAVRVLRKRKAAGTAKWGRRTFLLFATASLSLAVQWIAYLAAITSGRLVELSLGYYIYPLIAALLGGIFLKEKVDAPKIAALALAAAGVAVLVARHGGLPFLALVLAVSFSVYSIVKKELKADPLDATFYELLFLLPFALVIIARAETGGGGWFLDFRAKEATLLLGGGVATAATLLLFAKGARKIPMFALGFLQYISPTIVLALGVFAYRESFALTQWIAFGLIWLGVAVYSAAGLVVAKKASRKARAASETGKTGMSA